MSPINQVYLCLIIWLHVLYKLPLVHLEMLMENLTDIFLIFFSYDISKYPFSVVDGLEAHVLQDMHYETLYSSVFISDQIHWKPRIWPQRSRWYIEINAQLNRLNKLNFYFSLLVYNTEKWPQEGACELYKPLFSKSKWMTHVKMQKLK